MLFPGGSDGTERPHRHQHNVNNNNDNNNNNNNNNNNRNNNNKNVQQGEPTSGLMSSGGETLTDWAQMHPLCQRNLTAYVGQTARMYCCLARLDRELNVRWTNIQYDLISCFKLKIWNLIILIFYTIDYSCSSDSYNRIVSETPKGI